jgi:transcriptional regulator with PAS, ATPase and Fis domain
LLCDPLDKLLVTQKSLVDGLGKELFARFIHHHSERANRPFIAINSVGLSMELLESDLFGHEQGAFTGAHKTKKGKIELANGGTIFFDEIGDISREMQAKLLTRISHQESKSCD